MNINAMTGEVVGMDRWEKHSPGQKNTGLPKYSEQEAQKLAEEWIKKLLPGKYSSLKISPYKREHRPFNGLGRWSQSEYYFDFHRVVNNILFADNGAYVRISGETGEILGYHLNWDESLVFPSPTGLIGDEQAKKIFGENLELVYFRPINDNRANQVKLIYRVKNGSGLFIDANTGKVVEEPRYYDHERMAGALPQKLEKELTPAEQAELEKIASLITAERAMEQVRKVVKLPEGIKQQESRLMQDYEFPEQKIWQFHWNGQAEKNYYSMDAGVNAATGELLSFNIWHKPYEIPGDQPKYNGGQARQIAEDFLKKQQAAKFAQVRLESSQPDYISKDRSVTRAHRFYYTRLVNGAAFPGNGFTVQVDTFTGQITNYRMTWWDMVFPPASGYIERDKAADILLKEMGLTLGYRHLNDGEGEPQIRLVYHPGQHPSYMLDAMSGVPVDWRGQPIPAKQTRVFTDIAGHPAQMDIELLAQFKIVSSIDGTFRPDANITKIEAIEWLLGARGWFAEPPRTSQEDLDEHREKLINAAVNLGIIEKGETAGLDREVTRLELARLLINTLDYDGAAKLSKIYDPTAKTP